MMTSAASGTISERTVFNERLTPNKNVLSFDCGLKNLAYCLVEDVNTSEKEFAVRLWETLSLKGETLRDCVVSLHHELNSRKWMLHADHIAIEAQVSSNSQMKMISHVLQMYFLCNRNSSDTPSIHFISPKSKFKCTNVPEPPGLVAGHGKNKKIAIEMAKKMLLADKDKNGLAYLLSHKKQDDLADSYLQGNYFLRTLRRKVCKNVLKHLELQINEEIEEQPNQTLLFKADDFVLPTAFDIEGGEDSVKKSSLFRRQMV